MRRARLMLHPAVRTLVGAALVTLLAGCPGGNDGGRTSATADVPPPAQAVDAGGADAMATDKVNEAAGVATGAATDADATTPGLPDKPLSGSHWVLVEGIDGTDPAAAPTLAFESAARISGSGGCNGYSAELSIEGEHVTVGPVTATKRGCPGPRGRAEPAFFGALSQATALRRDGDRLVIERADGPPLVFRPASAPAE